MKLAQYVQRHPLRETVELLCRADPYATRGPSKELHEMLELTRGEQPEYVRRLLRVSVEEEYRPREVVSDFGEVVESYVAFSSVSDFMKPEKSLVRQPARRAASRYIRDLVRIGRDLVGQEALLTNPDTDDGRFTQLAVLTARASELSRKDRPRLEPEWIKVVAGNGDLGPALNAMLGGLPPEDERRAERAKTELYGALRQTVQDHDFAGFDGLRAEDWGTEFVTQGVKRLLQLRYGTTERADLMRTSAKS